MDEKERTQFRRLALMGGRVVVNGKDITARLLAEAYRPGIQRALELGWTAGQIAAALAENDDIWVAATGRTSDRSSITEQGEQRPRPERDDFEDILTLWQEGLSTREIAQR